mmetsp:Transcript_10285/g.15675  ORF Transcript_10285/g.15675 Transcript_10285/m.15675 type:complete len:159 (-) Transcript_10285:834-1310(-)
MLQWVLLGFESTFFLLSHGTEIVRLLGVVIYMVKIVLISLWGLVILYKFSGDPLSEDASGKLTPNKYLLAYTMVQYFTINELTIWPIQILKMRLLKSFTEYSKLSEGKRDWSSIREAAFNEPMIKEAESMVMKASEQAEEIANKVETRINRVRSYKSP